MRLMDLLANADHETMCVAQGSRRFDLRGAAAYAAAIRDCPLRYVLDDRVAHLCESLLESDVGMLEPANAFLRMQAESFWLEWTRDGSLPGSHARSRQRVGCLINAAADGRSGSLHSFWIDELDKAQLAQVYLEFDLDHLPIKSGQHMRGANHDRPAFQVLLDHVAVRIEPEWAPYFDSLSLVGRNRFFDDCTARMWFDLPMALAFAALLSAKSYVATVRSDLVRLNRARTGRGRPALLDHVETRLSLDQTARLDAAGERLRATPRLHRVRGHMVRRRDATFWRMTHLRGNPATSQLTKTVQVSSQL